MRRCDRDDIQIPDYYTAPLRRPDSLFDPAGAMAWDLNNHWLTAKEWLDWLRRRGRPYRVYGHLTQGRWMPQVRPWIKDTCTMMSTRKVGRLPDASLRSPGQGGE